MDTDPDDPVKEDYEVIMRETMRCRQIVRDLLDYARLEKPKREYTDLNRIIERAVNIVYKQAEFHDIRFEYDLDNDLPQALVDPSQIQQAILNLVINAKDAMNKTGAITLSSRSADSGGSAVIEVGDEGGGIPQDKMQEIFEPFYTTKGTEGNGLGLPVVMSIIEQHGGEVHIDTEVGKGTVFKLTIPAKSADAMEEEE
jgi:two-component system NtrC family sensor kinase